MAKKKAALSSAVTPRPSPASPSANHDDYSDAFVKQALASVRVIAVVGASANWNRPSFFVIKYLQAKGYRMIPVNPKEAGSEILGEKVYASVSEIPHAVDMVDIFRNSQDAGPITDEAIAKGAKLVWMQIGVRNDAAAERAEAAGLTVVMNRCPKIEHSRLYGELSWGGFNSGVISSKRRKL
ncbi:MAG: CoA-binding protein [Betaproteobacteria bacterium]|nr:MAG: CoA-binding protein [Betaproteobacteria bacterium]